MLISMIQVRRRPQKAKRKRITDIVNQSSHEVNADDVGNEKSVGAARNVKKRGNDTNNVHFVESERRDPDTYPFY